jgi:hypothetical protein
MEEGFRKEKEEKGMEGERLGDKMGSVKEDKILMGEISTFESRIGRLECSPDEIFDFVADIRNFERFVPSDNRSTLVIDHDSCTVRVDMLGNVKIRISEKTRPEKVVFTGNAPQVNDFSVILDIFKSDSGKAETKITLLAELNPLLKMMAAGAARQFLETLVVEMEKFKDWKDIR